MSNAARQAKHAGARESSGNGTTAGLPCLPVLEPSEKAIKEIFASKKDRERCRREVTCHHAVILRREIKTLQKTFVANSIRDKTLNPFPRVEINGARSIKNVFTKTKQHVKATRKPIKQSLANFASIQVCNKVFASL
jgi:hypothetical protein